MSNQAEQMYRLNHNEIVSLIGAIGDSRTVLVEGDMGAGKTSILHMLADRTSATS